MIWESHTILRYLAALPAPCADRRFAGREDRGRALDGLALGGPQLRAYARGVRGRAKKRPRSAACRFRRRRRRICAELLAIADRHLGRVGGGSRWAG